MKNFFKDNIFTWFLHSIRALSLLTISGIFFIIPFIVKAQDVSSLGMSVSPQVFELDVFPGEKIVREINLGNLSDVPMPILAKVTDFTAIENSGEMEFDESIDDPVIASRKWFKIQKPNFILEKNEKVGFEISIPKDAEPGGHYSVILFEPQLPSFYFKASQPKTIPVIGVLFLISVKTLNADAFTPSKPFEVVEFRIPDKEKIKNFEKALASIFQIIPGVSAAEINVVENPPSSFLLRIKNNDIFHRKISGKILIYNFWGKKVGETEIKKTTILPQKIRQFPIDIVKETPKSLKWLPSSISSFLVQNTSLGRYKVVLELGEEKNNFQTSQIINFWAFPWKMMLILFSILIPFVIIRKRLIAAAKILLKG